MRMTPDQKEAARAVIVAAAGRRFRVDGMAGVGIDALARDAGQTSGAIYAHFTSKADVFAAVVAAGLARLLGGVERARAAGAGWARLFSRQYLSREHRDQIADGCLLPSLSADVARSDPALRASYASQVETVIACLADGCSGMTPEARRQQAIGLLVLGAGGLLISRAMPSGALADEILSAAEQAVDAVLGKAA